MPPLLCLYIYRAGLDTWFVQDDYAWLGLRLQVHDMASLLRAVFMPSEHGTFRPFSERGFFLRLEEATSEWRIQDNPDL